MLVAPTGVTYRIVVPSRKRPGNMARLLELLPDATVTVEEGEVEDYAAVMPREQVWPHPPNPAGKPGLSWIKQWIVDNTPEQAVVMVDDDFEGGVCLVGKKTRRITEPEAIRAIFENGMMMAADLGLSLFAWSQNPNPTFFNAAQPFALVGHVDRVYGIYLHRKHKIRYDERCATMHNVPLVLNALLYDRVVLLDRRFNFPTGATGAGAGGLQGIRSPEVADRDSRTIARTWGQYIDVSPKEGKGHAERYHVTRKQSVASS